jgi:hypothetical protein
MSKFIAEYPELRDFLAKIAWEDDMHTPGLWGITIKIIEAFKNHPDALNALVAVVNDIESNDSLEIINGKIRKNVVKYSPTIESREAISRKFTSFIIYFTSPKNEKQLLAFRAILDSKEEPFENWMSRQPETNEQRNEQQFQTLQTRVSKAKQKIEQENIRRREARFKEDEEELNDSFTKNL